MYDTHRFQSQTRETNNEINICILKSITPTE